MKKGIIFLILFSLSTAKLFANRTIGFSLGYSENMEFPQKIIIEELHFTTDNFSVYIAEHSGQKLQIGASYNLPINKLLNHRFLIDTSLTYGSSCESSHSTYGSSYNTYNHTSALSGWSGLGYMFNANLAKPIDPKPTTHIALYLDLSLGVQLAVAYSPYFATALFSITPLCEVIAGIQFKNLEAQTYMSFITEQAKEWKAVPTIGAKALLTIGNSHRLGADIFIKFAEFLTDPSTLVCAFGVRILYEYKIPETTKRATNENT